MGNVSSIKSGVKEDISAFGVMEMEISFIVWIQPGDRHLTKYN